MFSRYTCSSSIDDDALAVALQAVGDCTLSADCLTSYNQYYGGWATVVDGKIVVGDLTEETQVKFSKQYLLGTEVEQSPYVSISWYNTDGLTIPTTQLYVPWYSPPSEGTIIEQDALQGFTLTVNNLHIQAGFAGTYLITYSIGMYNLIEGNVDYDFGLAITNPDLETDVIIEESYSPGTTAFVTLSGSCVCDLDKNGQVSLKNLISTNVKVRSVSISIRFISPPRVG